MVEPLLQRFECGLDREEIGNEAGDGINRALKPQFHAIGMPVQPPAAVFLRDIRQNMRRLETKCLGDFHTTTVMACR